MTVNIDVAPRAAKIEDASERQSSFLRRYQAGPCFLVQPIPGAADVRSLQGFAADAAEFSRFETDYRRELGADPQVRAQTIDPSECPALELLRAAADSTIAAPRIELTNPNVGSGKPLAGQITGLAGRHLTLVIMANDGSAHALPTAASTDGKSAQFSVKFTNDAEDIGHSLAVVAIVSDRPLSSLSEPRLGKASELVSKLVDEWVKGGAAADVQFAKLTR